MRALLLLLLFPAVMAVAVGQSDPYSSRGVRSFLVNYNAIKGDRFLAEVAAKRFVLIDEAGRADIPLLKAVKPDLPILRYKDIVAVYPWMDEFATVNLDEDAFLHSSEPSGLTLWQKGDSVYFTWLRDRRALPVRGYRLFTLRDSLDTPQPLDGLLHAGPPVTGKLPGDARFVLVQSASDSGEPLRYGFPVNVASEIRDSEPVWPDSIFTTHSGDTVRVRVVMRGSAGILADSLVLIGDWNRNNTLDVLRERRPMLIENNAYVFDTTFTLNGERSNSGYEFRVEIWNGGMWSRYPRAGSWHSTINNRLTNDFYGFYVMNVINPTWRKAFVEQILLAFGRDGYTGLFEDDCWYRVENYGVDAFPPVPYDQLSWRRGLYDMLDSIRTGIAPRPAYFNGLYTEVSDSLLLHTVGGMTEGFAYTHWSALVAGDSWRNQCNRGLSALHRYGKTWMALAGAPFDDPEGRLYAIASYLLLDDVGGMYATATSYQEFAHFPEFDIPLGLPLERAQLDVDDLAQGSGNARWYRREFERGTVIVNPSDTPLLYPDARGRRSVGFSGGTTVDGGTLAAIFEADSIPARSARIYLGSAGATVLASPVILDVRSEPAVIPADGGTPCRVSIQAYDPSAVEFHSDPILPLRITLDASNAGGSEQLVLTAETPGSSRDSLWYSASFTIPVGAPPDSVQLPFTVESTTGLFSVGRVTITIASADSGNLLPNYSFEIDGNRDGIPDTWRAYGKGFDYDVSGAHARSGARSIRVLNDSITDFRGVYLRVDLKQTEARAVEISGWSKCVDVSGTPDNDYALYVDAWYTDGTPLYGQAARFGTGYHDWEFSLKLITPEKPISHVVVYVLFRRHSGKAWFDHLGLRYPPPVSVRREEAVVPTMQVHPNPAQDVATVVVNGGDGSHVRCWLVDLNGRTLHESVDDRRMDGERRFTLPLKGLPTGFYIVRVQSRTGVSGVPLFIVR